MSIVRHGITQRSALRHPAAWPRWLIDEQIMLGPMDP
jgi:hypothetical protein